LYLFDKGEKVKLGIKRLALKKSNRIKEMEKGLAKMRIQTKILNSKFVI